MPPSDPQHAFALEVVQKLRNHGFQALFAGGCVRDQLLGIAPKDFDVATAARPDEVRQVFGRRRTLAIGASFGVITVLGPKPVQIEVATFRNDGHYSDGRHPDGVTFSSPEEDAARRDFTINGMFYDPIAEQVIDYVGGQDDLADGVIRAIGEPVARINEDRLRMLRAVRFAATYRFDIEAETMTAIQSHAEHLKVVSQERVTTELLRMLGHPNRSQAMTLLRNTRLLPHVIPQLASPLPEAIWSRLMRILSSHHVADSIVALSLIMGTEGLSLDAEAARQFCTQLKLSNEQRDAVVWILKNIAILARASELKRSELQPLLIQAAAPRAVACLRALAEIDLTDTTDVQACEAFLALPASEQNPEVFIRGGDLMEIGLEPGPLFAEVLHKVRSEQLDGAIQSKQEALELAQSLAQS